MDNPKYIQVMRQVASDFDGISHELFQVASDLERMDQYNPQQKLFSLVRLAEVSSVKLRFRIGVAVPPALSFIADRNANEVRTANTYLLDAKIGVMALIC